jgi:hypothetical protein
MLGQIPSYLQNIEGLYTGWNLYLWYSAIVVQLIISILLFVRSKKLKEMESVYRLVQAYGFFFLAMAINRFFFLWAYIPILGYFPPNYSLYLGIGYIFCSAALVPVIFVIEKFIVKKTKYIFTVLCTLLVIMAIITIFLPDNLVEIRNTMQLMGLGTSLIWFILYFWMIKNTFGDPRKKAINTVLGVIIALLGFTLDSERFLQMNIIPVVIPPILYIIGSIILTWVLCKKD